MDGFKNIEIKNFRGIDHLKIEDFSRTNTPLHNLETLKAYSAITTGALTQI